MFFCFINSINISEKSFLKSKTNLYLQSIIGARSSVGSEHLVYTQGVKYWALLKLLF